MSSFIDDDEVEDTSEIKTFWVPPLKPVKSGEFDLPAPDQVGITVIHSLVACFTTTAEFDQERFVQAVQTATSCIVWENPNLSGVITYKDEERHRIKLVIPEDPKIQVNVKYNNNLNAKDLKARHWPPGEFKYGNVCLDPTLTWGIDSYNFGVQANIIPGGLLLVLQMNHTILDGLSMTVTVAMFAHHLARAMDGKEPRLSGLLPPQALDKSTAYGTQPARGMLEWKDWKLSQKLSAEEAAMGLFERMQKLTITVWFVSKENQEKLRQSMQTPGKPKLTMASCLSTFLWKHLTRGRGHGPDVTSRLLLPVSARGRLKDMHANYTGSALVHSRTKATVAEIESLSAHELSERTGKSVEWWTGERIREFWGSIEECDDIAKYNLNTDRDFGTDIENTNLSNFPFYHTYWGRGIEVEAWRLPGVPFTDGWTAVLPRSRNGGNELILYMAKDTTKKLMENQEFRQYAEYWSSYDREDDAYAAETAPKKSKL